ncbi:helix-turn-helix domain-containing protein [Catenulispora sp. GAS73]|uniref:helix-turn-helix domain-containing protein n=1 Tax=Catenulispora sp. GAS73 TaxID=3156269 RepID=UPI0035189418
MGRGDQESVRGRAGAGPAWQVGAPGRVRTEPAGRAAREKALLACTESEANAAVARRLHRHTDTIRAWRKRFCAEGGAALSERPRPLGRPRFDPGQRLKVIAAARAVPPGTDTAWSHRLLGRTSGRAGDLCLADRPDPGWRRSKPHLVRGWLTRPADPEFFDNAADVCTLYRTCPARRGRAVDR